MSRVAHLARLIVLSLALLALWAASADAQEINWRTDFNKARQEAREKNLPILMDVGTTNCPWCVQLDKTTFRDPFVVKFVNDNFIPLRIDGDKYKSLIKMLKIERFPTVVVAGPEGKVVALREGYMEAAKFYPWAQQALALLDPVPIGGLQLTAGQKMPSAADRVNQARMLLGLAEEEFRAQQYVCCLAHCKTVAATFADLPEAEAARQLAAKLKSDPQRLHLLCDTLTESLCELYLELAASLVQAGQREQAVPYWQWIVQACPNTPAAATAQQMLQPSIPTFKVAPPPGK